MTQFEWHNFNSDKPKKGRKIVALWSDGGGAELVLIMDNGKVLDADGQDADLQELDFWHWAYLPDGFELFFENKRSDALSELQRLGQEADGK